MKKSFLIFLFMFIAPVCLAQEKKEIEKYNQISVVMGHAHISKRLDENGNNKWLIAAAWGLDYNYLINRRWSIGLHNDIVLEDYAVEGKETIERNFPVSSALVGSFKPIRNLAILAGAGGEFASEGNYFLWKIGLEYGIELSKNWELSPSITYDAKVNAYNTWLMGLGIGKKF